MAKYASEEFKCCISGCAGATKHHIYTQGSRPDLKNKEWNMIPVMQIFRDLFHKKGTKYMADKYPQVKVWLLDNGWEFDKFSRKWRNEGAVRNG